MSVTTVLKGDSAQQARSLVRAPHFSSFGTLQQTQTIRLAVFPSHRGEDRFCLDLTPTLSEDLADHP